MATSEKQPVKFMLRHCFKKVGAHPSFLINGSQNSAKSQPDEKKNSSEKSPFIIIKAKYLLLCSYRVLIEASSWDS